MVNKLLNSRLGTAFTTDPSVALWTYVKSIWGTSTGYTVPANTAIKFDTKFGEVKGFYNFFVVENMPSSHKPQIIGANRFSVSEVKRIQIMCVGKSAKNVKWNMENHISSLINGNITGMQSYGIDSMILSDFTEIPTTETETIKTDLQPNVGFQKTRSFATVTLRYDLESASV